MLKKIFILTFLLIGMTSLAQSDYYKGFQSGYKEGYCYNEYGCIPPIPPISPIPQIGENSNNYQDGYNRGFKNGLEDKKNKENNQTRQNQTGQSQVYTSSYNSSDYEVLLKAMEMKQAQMEMYQAQNERNTNIKKEKALATMNQIKSYYNSLTQYPTQINDGWHKVISMNNYDFCEERKVYVENNKITKYIVDDWNNRPISYSLLINKAKTIIQLLNDNGENGEMLELYFLDFINNPTSYTSPPVSAGKVSFWTNWKKSGNLKLYFDGKYSGTFKKYFSEGRPNCGQIGTITINSKPGTYSYKAISNTKTWKGTVTVTAEDCFLQGLVK